VAKVVFEKYSEYATRRDNDLLDWPGQQFCRSFRFGHFGDERRWLSNPLDLAQHNAGCLAAPISLSKHICAVVSARVMQRIDDGFIDARTAHMLGATTLLPAYLRERWPNLEVMRVSAHWLPYFIARRHYYRLQQGHLPAIGDNLLDVLDMNVYACTVFGVLVEDGHPEHGERLIREARLVPSAIVVMLSPSAASHLGRCTMILIDGTFKVRNIFYFILLSDLNNKMMWEPDSVDRTAVGIDWSCL